MKKFLGKHGAQLINNKRLDYLPLLWKDFNPQRQPFRFVKEFDTKVTGHSIKFKFSKRRVFGEKVY